MTRRLSFPLLMIGFLILGPGNLPAQKYKPGGKRDPFVNVQKAQKKARPQVIQPPPFGQRPPGLSGLLVSEVTVVGTAANSSTRLVILRGTDNFSYVARQRSRLFDGYVKTISAGEVIFIREVLDTAGGKKVEKVVKRFYTESR
ncbi:MAG: hypothetical protein ACE5JX_11450 [Acidobacteriota bacterium]